MSAAAVGFSAMLITAVGFGVALGALLDAHGWLAPVYGGLAAANLAMCAPNIGLMIKRDGTL